MATPVKLLETQGSYLFNISLTISCCVPGSVSGVQKVQASQLDFRPTAPPAVGRVADETTITAGTQQAWVGACAPDTSVAVLG